MYIKGFLGANNIQLPEVESTAQATERARQQIRDGADGIKVLANSIESDGIFVGHVSEGGDTGPRSPEPAPKAWFKESK